MKKRRWPRVMAITAGVLVVAVVAMALRLQFGLPPGVEKAAPLPAMNLKGLDGVAIDLASLRGKVVLLDFWSST